MMGLPPLKGNAEYHAVPTPNLFVVAAFPKQLAPAAAAAVPSVIPQSNTPPISWDQLHYEAPSAKPLPQGLANDSDISVANSVCKAPNICR